MANIQVSVKYPLYDGMPLTFKAPCDCTSVEGLTLTYNTDSKSFVFKDAHGNTLTGIGNLFEANAYVKVILDTVNGFAFLQNADTNAYLEEQLNAKAPKYTYGTTDLVPGQSPLETGTLHFVYA